MEEKIPVHVLIAAPRGIMRSSLNSYILTLENIYLHPLLETLDDAILFMKLVHTDILVIDCDLLKADPSGTWQDAVWLKDAVKVNPHLKIVMLMDDSQGIHRAVEQGVYAAFVKGSIHNHLKDAILPPVAP
jgi:hypothetical protein